MNHDGYTITGVRIYSEGLVPDGLYADHTDELDNVYTTSLTGAWDLVSPGATPETWTYDATSALACSSPSCGTGDWRVLWDPFGSAPASASLCDTYVPIMVDITRASVSTTSLVPSESTCAAGSGRFQLIPVRYVDEDGDSDGRVTYKPAMISGTGRLTNAAAVTAIELVDNGGYALRVLKASAQATFSSSDALNNASTVSYAITGKHTFNPGNVGGVPVFVHSQVPTSALIDGQVDLSWTCGGSPTGVTLPQGYTFRTDDLGCPGKSLVTMRPHNGRVSWELYGDATYAHDTPLGPQGQFQLSWGGVTAAGRIVSTGQSSIDVELTSASLSGIPLCDPGTYTINMEQ